MSIAYQFVTYNATAGNKEDVLDLVTQISPEDTPFLSRLGISSAYNRYHEWLTDYLGSGTGTGYAAVEGADMSSRALVGRSRAGNYTQITTHAFEISGTQEVVSHYGVDSEYAYQLEKAMKELKIMMEQALIYSTTSTGGMGTVCATGGRSLRGMLDAITTNYRTGSANVCALSESEFNALLQTIFEAGGKPNIAFCAGFNKRRISAFATSNTRTSDMSGEARLRNFISVYESDFGVTEIVLDRYCPANTVPVLQSDMWKIAYLRRPFTKDLAPNGDSKRTMIIAEYTLEHLNEASSGKLTAYATA